MKHSEYQLYDFTPLDKKSGKIKTTSTKKHETESTERNKFEIETITSKPSIKLKLIKNQSLIKNPFKHSTLKKEQLNLSLKNDTKSSKKKAK